MTDTVNARELVLGILMEVTREGGYSHMVLRSVLEKYQYLEKQERAFITRVSEGTIQHMIELDYIINQFSKVKVNKMKPVIRNILRMSVYQMKYMDSVPDSAACNEAVKLARKKGFSSLSGFVNGVLRNISRNLDGISYPDEEKNPMEALSVRYSMPEWIVEDWIENYGSKQTKAVLEAFLQETPLTIRTNLLKITPEELRKRLEAEGVTVQSIDEKKYPGLAYAFAISGFDYLNALPSFQEGLFYVQDISSMMVAELAEPKEGSYVIDVCAAPGGKSIHLAEKMKGTGMVEARDLTEYKVAMIEENIARHKLSNVRAVCQDATVFSEDSVETADVLIADLPCSGLGILRKKTDIKYKMSRKQQEELVQLQRQILDTVWQYVKKGGTLIYSTCTIHCGENEENVRWFVENHPEFTMQEMKQIFPEKNLGDGFFIAKFIRK
ncbi:MAG: 16S rRNA (cytosine(967)-C(5))-methyltransferase RsmB [Clostridiales bacterium]|nr:16S rRNA (cytosine(967)-C(5))-methyltransferase RsmB [Clostridiales bacterium]